MVFLKFYSSQCETIDQWSNQCLVKAQQDRCAAFGFVYIWLLLLLLLFQWIRYGIEKKPQSHTHTNFRKRNSKCFLSITFKCKTCLYFITTIYQFMDRIIMNGEIEGEKEENTGTWWCNGNVRGNISINRGKESERAREKNETSIPWYTIHIQYPCSLCRKESWFFLHLIHTIK